MLTFVLPESRTSLAGMAQSTFLHLALVSGAVWGTRSVDWVEVLPPPVEIDLSWQPATTVTPGPVGDGMFVQAPVISWIPTELPSIDPVMVGPHPVDPRTLIGVLSTRIGTDTTGPLGPAATIYQESEVDDVPVLRSAPAPRYPRVMAEAGIEGSVTLSFVIDAEGRVVAGSARVVRASHEAFVAAAEEAVYGSLFTPAKRRGEGVPVLVRQTVAFRQ
jgi:TonB family protein